MGKIEIGVIGGSGLYEMDGLEVIEERRIETPWGDPSDAFIIGRLEDARWLSCPATAAGIGLLPSELNYRANLYGMKVLGVEWILSVSAVGSLKLEYEPTDIVVPDQFYDRTRHRGDTFFGNGLVAHVPFAHPTCDVLMEWMTLELERPERRSLRRHLRLHGRAAVLDAGRVGGLPFLRLRRDRYDQPAGGQVGPRGRDELRDLRHGHRL